MLCTNEVQVFGEKSKYWDQVLTIDFADIVYLHCHYKGTYLLHVSNKT